MAINSLIYMKCTLGVLRSIEGAAPQPCQGHLAAAGVVEDAPHGALNPSYEAMKAAL